MHARIVLAAGATAISLAGAAHAQNMLVNGDLEVPLDALSPSEGSLGWTLSEPDVTALGDPVDTASFHGFANHTGGGDRGLWLKSFQGGWSDDSPATVRATLSQTVGGQGGREYTLSAWFRFEANYTSGNTMLALDFLDSDSKRLSSAVLDINTLNANDSVWREFSVVGIADVGTQFVRARVSMVDGQQAAANPQSAFVDDLNLVPSPASAALLTLGALPLTRRRRVRAGA